MAFAFRVRTGTLHGVATRDLVDGRASVGVPRAGTQPRRAAAAARACVRGRRPPGDVTQRLIARAHTQVDPEQLSLVLDSEAARQPLPRLCRAFAVSATTAK